MAYDDYASDGDANDQNLHDSHTGDSHTGDSHTGDNRTSDNRTSDSHSYEAEQPTGTPSEAVVDLQCRFMDLELLVSELNEVVIELGAQLQESERTRRALAKRVEQLEANSADPHSFN